MAQIVREWAGRERVFALDTGAIMDIEEALGRDAVGALFKRITRGEFRAGDIFHTIRIALAKGGETPVEVKRLMADHFERAPLLANAALASDILLAVMSGVEPDEDQTGAGSDPEPIKFSEVSQICRVFHMSPNDLRALPYADLVNMIKGFNAASGQKLQHITDEEFEDILARYEPEALRHG